MGVCSWDSCSLLHEVGEWEGFVALMRLVGSMEATRFSPLEIHRRPEDSSEGLAKHKEDS